MSIDCQELVVATKIYNNNSDAVYSTYIIIYRRLTNFYNLLTTIYEVNRKTQWTLKARCLGKQPCTFTNNNKTRENSFTY